MPATLADRISAIYNQLADEAQKRFTADLSQTDRPALVVLRWESDLLGADGCGCAECQCGKETE